MLIGGQRWTQAGGQKADLEARDGHALRLVHRDGPAQLEWHLQSLGSHRRAGKGKEDQGRQIKIKRESEGIRRHLRAARDDAASLLDGPLLRVDDAREPAGCTRHRVHLPCRHAALALGGTQKHSGALRSTQEHSGALRSTQQHSAALSSTQQHSAALSSGTLSHSG